MKTLFHPILMHFAAKLAGRTYREFASDHRVLVESNILAMERFKTDAVGLISDPYRETSAFGAKVSFPLDGVPRCEELIVRTLEDVKALKNPDVYKAARTLDRIEGAKYYRQLLGKNVPVIGWIEGPLAEACDLAGLSEILVKLAIEPEFVKPLMEKCLVTAKDFAKAQIEAGCDIIGVGDAICSQISAGMYEEHVVEFHRELFDFIHSLGAKCKLHICGNITHLLKSIARTEADIVDIDWMVNTDGAHEALGTKSALSGNLDPVSVIERLSAVKVYESAVKLVEREKGKNFILSGGCEITVRTPAANLESLSRAARGA